MGNEVNFRTNRGIEGRNSSSATGFFFFFNSAAFSTSSWSKTSFLSDALQKSDGI